MATITTRMQHKSREAIIHIADSNNKIVKDSFENRLLELSADDYALICRALSDSMNYNSEFRFEDKWNLLLKTKVYQKRMEETELKEVQNNG